MRIHEVMSPDVVHVSPDDTVAEAKLLLDRHGIHHLVVMERRKVLGLVSDRDLADVPPIARLRDVMTRALVTVEPSATLRHAAALMDGNAIQSLPVVEGGTGKLCGIVTVTDLLRALAKGSSRPVSTAAPRAILRNRGPRRRPVQI